MLYSKSTGGFYTKDIHGANIPSDAVEITEREHVELLDGQSAGRLIQPNLLGRPALADRPPPTTEQLKSAARAKRNKLIADTDFMLIQDYPAPAEQLDAVKAYRQSLRDITAQPGFPSAIDWPIF